MPRLFTLGSIVIHAVVIVAVFVAQLRAIGPLPTPHRALMFDEARLVTIATVETPPAQSRAVAAAHGVSRNAAPLDAPPAITKETGLEGAPTRSTPIDAGVGTERGIGDPGGLGTIESVAPPPLPPAQPPRTPVRLHAGIEAPQKVLNVTPEYPVAARIGHVEGVVVLEAVIDAQGGVESVRVLKSIPPLDQSAVRAVRAWRFTPARLNGEAIPVVMTVTVSFSLQNR